MKQYTDDRKRRGASEPSTAATVSEPPSDLLYDSKAESSETPRPPTRRPAPFDFIGSNQGPLKDTLVDAVIEDFERNRRAMFTSRRSHATVKLPDDDTTSDAAVTSSSPSPSPPSPSPSDGRGDPSAFHKQCLATLKLLCKLKQGLESRRRLSERQRETYTVGLQRREWLDFRAGPQAFLKQRLGIWKPEELLGWSEPSLPLQPGVLLDDRATLNREWDYFMAAAVPRWMKRDELLALKEEFAEEEKLVVRQIESVENLIMCMSRVIAENQGGCDDDSDENWPIRSGGGWDEDPPEGSPSRNWTRSGRRDSPAWTEDKEEREGWGEVFGTGASRLRPSSSPEHESHSTDDDGVDGSDKASRRDWNQGRARKNRPSPPRPSRESICRQILAMLDKAETAAEMRRVTEAISTASATNTTTKKKKEEEEEEEDGWGLEGTTSAQGWWERKLERRLEGMSREDARQTLRDMMQEATRMTERL
ncbi:hypothetical protein JDV02_008420 [Purpureocillium takamizusanense]|uniref:Uncharacterized protein n=1 Tax=Purpureocillium takamizusanense TaxID=2060973 RepID=A0A9Q8QMP4_9HYPO|nr:uncharacterized protein JDV02_008420 [Purpureocillium takamizusanense]UNI22540.1 hypothetical protein JDV02_008420 [Purpureocillium takamizusanense]